MNVRVIRRGLAVGGGVLVLAALIVWAVGPWRAGAPTSPEQAASQSGSPSAGPESPPRAGWIKVGGVWRPPTDVAAQSPEAVASTKAGDSQTQPAGQPDPGRSPLIPLDANEHVKSVAVALREPAKYPERLSSFIAPAPFDRAAYTADPHTYLTTVEPGRVYQTAQPGEGVKPLLRSSPRYQRILQGETVTLQAQAEPGMPVTFFSARLGQFNNLLSTITVAANADGVAEVQFTATPGTQGDIDVLAASPVHSQQARYVIHVELPEPPPRVRDAAEAS